MAHGWDSYYHNLSSDPRPLKRTTQSEGSFSQQIENLIGHHDFTSTVASHGPPATTANFNANCFSNPGIGSSSSDCVYQRYYTESSWQADGQQMGKDYLPQCENGDMPDFATDGLLPSGCFPPSFPADLQGIKQDCGMLTASFLEGYSDVSTCLDTDAGETRPSCKFMANNLDQKPKTDSTTKHSLTEWLFSHTGSTVFPTESLPNNVAHTHVGLSSSSNVKSSVECSVDKMKNREKIVSSSSEHDISSTANTVTTTASETLEDRNNYDSCRGSKHKEEMDRDTQGKHLDIIGDHKNLTDGTEAYPISNVEEQTAPSAIATFHNEQQHFNEELLKKETEESFNRERKGSRNGSTNGVQVGTKMKDKTQMVLKWEKKQANPVENMTFGVQTLLNHNSMDKEDKTMETDFEEKDIELGTSQSSDLFGFTDASNELTKCTSILENSRDKTVGQDNSGKSTVIVAHDLSEASDKNRKSVPIHTSSCSHLNSSSKNRNPCLDNYQTGTVQTNATSSNMDCNCSAATSESISANVADKNRKSVADHSESVLGPKESSIDIKPCSGKKPRQPTGGTNTKSSTDLECSSSIVIGGDNEQTMMSHVATHSQHRTANTDTDPVPEEEGLGRKNTISSVDSNCSGSEVIGDILSVENRNKNKQGVADTEELVLQTYSSTEDRHTSLEKDCTSKKKTIILDRAGCPCQQNEEMDQTESPVECSDTAVAQQSFCSCSNIIPSEEGEMINPPGSESTTPATKNTTQKLLDQNPVNLKPQHPDVDVTENARHSFEELGTPPEEQSVFDSLYGEPLSREDSSCDTDETNLGLSQHKEASEAKTGRKSMENSKGQVPQIDVSRQMRNLQPVVILEDLESANEMSNMYYCATCKHTTNSVRNLIEHHHRSHSVNDFQFCKSCDVYLMRNEQTEEHLCGEIKDCRPRPSDSNLKKTKRHGCHKCNRCGLIFSKVVIYIRHMRTHTGKTPFRCNKCGLYFAQGCSLRRHKRVPGRCKEVKPPVASSDAVTTKTKTPAQKNRPCPNLPECYVKLFDISKTNLCNICNRTFPTAEKTKKHIYSMHKWTSLAVSPNGEIPKEENETKAKYKCPLCPRLFKYSYNRARHLRDCVRDSIYGGKKKVAGKYLCPLCHATFTLSSNRHRHIKAVCLRQCLNDLAKQRAKSSEKVEQRITKEMEQKIQPGKDEQKKQVPFSGADPKIVRRYKCNLCPAAFSHASGKYKHQKKHELFKLTGKKFKYRNSFSTSKAANSTSVNNHIRKEDTQSPDANISRTMSCHFCGKCFATSHSLKKHERSHRGERPYRCLECRKGFKKPSHLIAHKIVHQRRIQCTVCRKILPTVGELIQHRTSHHDKGKLQCPDCDHQFQFPVQLLRHLDSHKKRENKASQLVEKSPQQPPESVKDHSGELQLQCSLCKEAFDDAQVLRKHCLTHISRSSSHQCPFCKHNFSSRRYLLRHMIKHTGDKPYSCGNCGKQFYRDLYLKLHNERCFPPPARHHVTVGYGTKTKGPYQCSYCPRTFNKKMRLKSHHQGHKLNSLALCSRCGQYFGLWKLNHHQKDCVGTAGVTPGSPNDNFNKSISQVNQNVHKITLQSNSSNMFQFKCPDCTQRFRYRSLLLRHMVTHTGLQPYPCMHCGHRFSSQGMCLQHEAFCDGVSKEGPSKVKSDASTQRTAIGEITRIQGQAEYKCKFCTKTFTKSRKLRHHILTHNEVKPYRCKACDSCFSRYDHLKVHQTRCKGRKARLEVCIPKISLEDIGKGWQNRFGLEPVKKEETFECKVCVQSFPSQSKLSRHDTMFHVAKLFKCSRCGSAFCHETTLKKHRRMRKCRRVPIEAKTLSQHPNPMENVTNPLHGVNRRILERLKPCFNRKYKYACSYCPRAFRKSWQLNTHTRLHTGEKPYACDYCGQRFIRKDYVQRHYPKCSKKQEQDEVLCDQCGGLFSKVELKNHKKQCITSPNTSKSTVCQDKQSTSQDQPKGFSCAYCNSRFLLFSQLQEHFIDAHKLETLAPPIATASLQHHLSNISSIKEEPLDKSCDEQRGEDAKLTWNLNRALTSNVTKQFFCPECKAFFASKSALTAHLRGHAMEYPFNCNACKKGFWNKTLLRNHHRKCKSGHTSEWNSSTLLEGPLKAEIDFALNDPALMCKEESTTSGSQVPQADSPCKDDLSNKLPQNSGETLVQTNSQENKVVQYQCSECDESFTDGLVLISHLEEHGRQEQEKKRNTCFKCGSVCSSAIQLEIHMKNHGMDQEYACPDCSKVLYTQSALKVHRTYHDPNRPFVCKLCNQRFWTRPSLCNHYKEEHPGDVFSCRFCNNTYSLKKSLQRHYKKWHQKEQKDLGSTVLERSSNASQLSTLGETDEDENYGSGDSDSDSAPYFPCHVCGKTFPTSESLEDHQRCHLGEKPHECEECGKCFFQASQLQQHQRMHKSEFQCQMCGRGFVSLFALRKHKHSHGKSRPYRCSRCDLSFTGPSQLAEHMSTHREENFPCDICNRVFHSKSSRAEHRKCHSKSCVQNLPSVSSAEHEKSPARFECSLVFSKEPKYRCGVCSDRFRDPEELSEHGCMAAKERLYSCSDCNKHFLHASHLKKHRTIHHPSMANREYACNKCNNSFSSPQLFLNHIKTHADTAGGTELHEFICPVCRQCFASAIELCSHFPTHPDDIFECRTCKVTFPSRSKLNEHEQHHLTSSTELECSQSLLGSDAVRQHDCSHQQHAVMENKNTAPSGKLSARSSLLAGEEEDVDVTGEDLYNCPVCSMQFSSKSSFLEHQNKVHLNEKPFKCELCGKSFSLRKYLKEHERRHLVKPSSQHTSRSPAKRFRCTQCNTQFTTTQDLSAHMRMHAEEQVGEYRCDMCYKSFRQWQLLKVHQESHVGEVVYECTECDKAFAFPHLLEEHQQTHAGSSH